MQRLMVEWDKNITGGWQNKKSLRIYGNCWQFMGRYTHNILTTIVWIIRKRTAQKTMENDLYKTK